MSMLKKTTFLVILASLVSLTTLSSRGFCAVWERVGGNEDFTIFFAPDTVWIDKENKMIQIWLQYKYTEKGKNDFLAHADSNKRQQLKDVSYTNILTFLIIINGKWLSLIELIMIIQTMY